jgi:hypothetical protein
VTRRVTDSPAVVDFLARGAEYVELIDRHREWSAAELLVRVFAPLASLVADALRLPSIGRPGPEEPRHDDPCASWVSLYESLKLHLASQDTYWEIYDPYVVEKPITGSLADCLAAVHDAICPGLNAWASASAGERRSIVWQWRFQFEIHWGHHAIDALRAIHSLLFEHNLLEVAGGE